MTPRTPLRALVILALVAANGRAQGADVLASWNEGSTKAAIVEFVDSVTRVGGPNFVRPEERIAVFDNDGTLWSEQPMYIQLAFAIDRVKALAPQRPEWKATQPFRAALEGDMEALAESGSHGLLELIMTTHAGMTTEEFEKIVEDWLATARHPTLDVSYTDVVYVPMVELLQYLRANGFKTFVVSGGGIEFMRPWTERVYGIPPEQVVGSSIETKFEVRDGVPVLVRLPEMNFVDDKAGKPVGIHLHIGRRPILAFGNSDGDFEMLEWVTGGTGPRLGLLLHHDDGEREWAYDRESHIGRLDRGLDEASRRGWILTSMRNEWNRVFGSRSRR